MRVLFVCTNLKTGGAERQWSLLLPGLRQKGFDVGLLALTVEGEFFAAVRDSGVPSACARMRSRTDVPGLIRALRYSRWKPDVVVTNSLLGHIVGHALARRARARHMATEHAISSVATVHPSRSRARRVVASRVDRVIGVTQEQAPYLTSLGYRPERMEFVWSGIPDIAAVRPRSEVRAELGLDAEDFAACLIATLRPEKRADLFLDAILRAHEDDPRIRGFIAGRGPQLSVIRERAAARNSAVSVLGDRSDVPDLMEAADAVCLTSETEALPMVVIEAMALGRPVIATNVGGTGDLVVSGETGVLIPPGDEDALVRAILDARAQPERLKEYAAAARQRQQAFFTLARMVEGYAGVLTDLMASPRA
jgi:glycosyltransferase involved in cell wall biosynthesis